MSYMSEIDDIIETALKHQADPLRPWQPAWGNFVQEARLLIQNLERLTAKIERDPARFILGTQSPEFRR